MRTDLIRTLSAQIKPLSVKSRELKAEVNSKSYDRWREYHQLANVKAEIRTLHRAIAFLKGVPYKEVEPQVRKVHDFRDVKHLLDPLLGTGPFALGDPRSDLCIEWNDWVIQALYHIEGQCTAENKYLHFVTWEKEVSEERASHVVQSCFNNLLDHMTFHVATPKVEKNTEEVKPC